MHPPSEQPSSPPPVRARPEAARVKVAASHLPETRRAVHQVLDELEAEQAELVLLFFSPRHDPSILARALDDRVGGRGVAGTTSGELTPTGFAEGALVGLSLCGEGVRASLEIVPQLERLSLVPLLHVPELLARRIGRPLEALDPSRHLWLTLVDGLSGRESLLTPFFAQLGPQLDLVGGSLADLQFQRVRLIHHGRVYRNAAAFVLLEYDHPFYTFHSSHHVLSQRWVTVTGVSEDGLTLEELDGRPAASLYAELLGCAPDALTTEQTGRCPLGRRFRGRAFPVAVMRPLPRGCLQVGTPVYPGERLNLLASRGLLATTQNAIADALGRVGKPGPAHGMLLFHCLGRYLEAAQHDQLDALFGALDQAPLCGLNTFGEQYGALHVNHSITGVVFG